MPLTPPIGTCQAQLLFTPIDDLPEVPGTTVQFNIGATPITGVVNIGGAASAADIQNAVNADATYQASGTTIVISISTGHLQTQLIALIQKNATSPIIDMANGTYFSPTIPKTITDSAPFTCNLVKKNKKKGSGAGFVNYGETFCVNRHDKFGREIPCLDKVSVGYAVYVKISTDQYQCCYKKIN